MTRQTSANLLEESTLRSRSDGGVAALPLAFQGRRAALVIAHPGHELRVYHWLKLARPTVYVLTDGSGRSGDSRLTRTTSIIEQVGADTGSIYGRMTDAELYSAIIRRDIAYFVDLAAELAQCLRDQEIEYVVGDALEGYNPAHDLCRYVINAAIMSLSEAGGRLENYDVLIADRKGDHAQHNHERTISFELDAESITEKMQIAQSYTEMLPDVQRVLANEGIESVKTEQLRCLADLTFESLSEVYYEVYGRRQVAEGHYKELLTYRDHLRPIAEALQTLARKEVRRS